jgi:hypothetical protein
VTVEAVEDLLQSPRDGSERVAVAILGGSHDRTDASDRQNAAAVAYVGVSVQAYKDVAG